MPTNQIKKASTIQAPRITDNDEYAALVPNDPIVQRLFRDTGFFPERVNPKSLTKQKDGEEMPEQLVLDRLLADGYTDAASAFDELMNVFGSAFYADKNALAEDGTQFRIRRVVQRVEGSVNGEDDWAMEIVMPDGEMQILTMGMNKNIRDRQMWLASYTLSRFGGETNPLCLARYELKGERHFFALVKPGAVGELRNVTNEPDAIEAEFRQVP